MRVALPWLALLLLAGCFQDAQARQNTQGDAPQAPEASQEVEALAFEGRVVPTEATGLRAPQNVLRLRTWTSVSGWSKLVFLAPDGEAVKEGDVVGRFEFNGDRARPNVQQNIDEARANGQKSRLEEQQTLDNMRTQLNRQRIEAENAKLDTLRGDTVSARDLKIYQMAHRIADFEANATERLIGVHRRRMASEASYHDKQLAQAAYEMELLDSFKRRFEVRAPHDGIVRHGYSRRRRRKLQKGDGMPAGYEFASLARDRSVSVEFFIPEHRLDEVSVGGALKVSSPILKAEVEGEVVEVTTFPQELGFLREDEELAGGREKMYVARARLKEPPEALRAGLEVKVRQP
jgi:hypothetical protein